MSGGWRGGCGREGLVDGVFGAGEVRGWEKWRELGKWWRLGGRGLGGGLGVGLFLGAELEEGERRRGSALVSGGRLLGRFRNYIRCSPRGPGLAGGLRL